MNNKEYWSQANALSTPNYKMIHAKLEKWKLENNITERCAVHHRDDTEETRKYNEEHYERWGFNEDGTFEYGTYVIFMTLSEHTAYHKPNSYFTEETRRKLSAALTGRVFTTEHRERIGASLKGRTRLPPSDETRRKMSESHKGSNNAMYGRHHSDETRDRLSELATKRTGSKNPMYGKIHSEKSKQKMRNTLEKIRQCYAEYKSNGGMLAWSEFRHALKTGEIQMEV